MSRGIAHVPGLPQPPEPEWYDQAIEAHRSMSETEAERERQAAEDAQSSPQSTSAMLQAAIAQANVSPVPGLNSAAILRGALAGGSGTINGEVIQGRNE